jgi:signal transduction histidine kinase
VTERFYRGRGQAEMGSGLGLAIVKSIVEVHGGRVSVTSQFGQGTEVRLVWPGQAL